MQSLQFLIDQLTIERNLHISIVDLTGVLNTPMTKIAIKNIIHSKHFCDIAKSSPKGYHTCMRCKKLANTKATRKGVPFCGCCVYGLYEAVFPVIINNTVSAIIYIGNAVINKNQTVKQIEKICKYTCVNSRILKKEIDQCYYAEDTSELLQIAELVADYLKMLYKHATLKAEKLHWLVSVMKCFADEMYCSNISLKELAVTYQKNEKYLGRLFLKETGISFHKYLMQLRLNKAESLLLQSTNKIIDIAFDCGFNTVSYFNRAFKKKYGMTPKEYRMKNGHLLKQAKNPPKTFEEKSTSFEFRTDRRVKN